MIRKQHTYPLRIAMLMLVLSLLLQAMAIPTFAQEGREIAADAPVSAASQDIGSDEYRSRFTADAWTSVGDAGVLMQNTSEGIRMDITGRGAALGATLLAYDGQTSCNALRFVLENRSACTEMQLRVTYTDGSEADCSVQLVPQSDRTVYYGYLDQVELVRDIQIIFHAISDGEVVLYAVSRVSFYDRLDSSERYGSVSECYYDAQSNEVILKGSLHTNAAIRFSGGSVALYRLSPAQTLQSLLESDKKPLQTVKISNHFTFSVPANTYTSRNSYYALVLIDAQGNRAPMCEPCFPAWTAQPDAQSVQGRAYKGLYGCDGADAMQYRAGAVIVDVYLDELMKEGGGEYVSFSFDNLYFSFDRVYMQQLEQQIAPLMKVGCEVYLRILIRATPTAYQLPFTVRRNYGAQEPDYLAVTITSANAQSAYGAVLNYLLNTFSAYGQGIGGIILGKGIDRSLHYNYAGMLSLQEYLQTVVDAALQTENALRAVFPDALLYLPVTDTVYPTYYTSYDLDGIYDTSMLLDGICRMLDDSGLGSFTFAPLLESDQMPFVLSEDAVEEGADAVAAAIKAQKATEGSKTKMTVAKLAALSSSYDSMLPGGALLWTPPGDCTDAAFALYYIYQYYANINGVTNTLFADLSGQSIREQQALLRGIDTNTVDALTDYALPYFGLSAWDDLSSADRAYKSHMKKMSLYQTELTEEYRSIYMGSYPYWNFATAIGSMQWEASYGCDTLTADGGSSYGRALLARMRPQGGEILYTFAKPENFSICDALTLTLAATDQTGATVPAKVYLTMYGGGKRVEAHGVLEDGALTSLTLSGLPLSALKSCCAISLRVEPLEPQAREDQELRVYLLRVEGMSRTRGSDALQAEILAQREAHQPVVENVSLLGAYPMLLITGSMLLTLAGALMCLRASKKRKNTH